MISVIGIISFPILLASIIFIYYHARFISLYNCCRTNHDLLHELMLHKYELLQFFSQDIPESQSDDFEINLRIGNLEELLCDFNFSEEDSAELAAITHEIEEAQNMYVLSKDKFEKFTNKFPGKILSTFLMGRSMR